MFKIFGIALLAVFLYAGVGQAQTPTQTVTFGLSWTDNSSSPNGEDGFRLYRCTGSTCSNFVVVDTVAANVVSVNNSISGDTGGVVYRYRVTAFNAAGESVPSNIVNVTSPVILLIPNAPSGLIGTVVGVTVP